MKETISIKEIFQMLTKRLVLILSITIVLIGVVAIYSYYIITPVYQSSSQFIVIQQQNEAVQFSLTEIETNLELINTYSEIIKSPAILIQVIDEMNLTITPEELGKQVEVSSGENSQVVTVSAIAASPEAAADLANIVVEQFKSTISTIMNIENVFVLSNANPALSQEPITPKPMINMIIAGIIGLATGVGLSLSLEFLNTKVKTESDVEELGITVLGVISIIDKKRLGKRSNSNYVAGKEEESIEA